MVNTGIRNYHKIYGIFNIILGKFMACFFIIPMEKQAMNFKKNCAQCAIMLSSPNFHGMMIQNTVQKY